jgi:phosphoribosylglycinamide formyltransferase-1
MCEQRTRLGALVSGGGSNLQAVLDAIAAGTIHGDVVLVISDRPHAYALERARAAGIATAVLTPDAYPSREAYSQAIADCLQQASVDLVLYAGFMRIVTREAIAPFRGRMMNIHPALIPSFCGPGFYGRRVHEAALHYGVKVSGCTVHFVEEDVDGGPIIVQRTVPVLEDDTPETLAARILEQEHQAYVEAVRLFCAGRLRVEGRLVRILPERPVGV